MSLPELQLLCKNAPWSRTIEFQLRDDQGRIAQPVTMEKCNNEMVQGATFDLTPKQAQILMDDLWHCGLRPTQTDCQTGALSATREHLKDMRRLVFTKDKLDEA